MIFYMILIQSIVFVEGIHFFYVKRINIVPSVEENKITLFDASDAKLNDKYGRS